jgi:hypothetical protein
MNKQATKKQDKPPANKVGDKGKPAADESKKVKDDKQKKAKKVKDNQNAIKRAKSAYNCFCEDQRAKVVKDNPDAKPKDVMRLLGECWKEIKEDQKKKYDELAAKDKERYQKEKEAADSDVDVKKDKKKPTQSKHFFIF